MRRKIRKQFWTNLNLFELFLKLSTQTLLIVHFGLKLSQLKVFSLDVKSRSITSIISDLT